MPSILVINPNSTGSMTEGLRPLVERSIEESHPALPITYTLFNPPTGPASINNDVDAAESTTHCISQLQRPDSPLLPSNDAFLVACYSEHPLEPWIAAQEVVKASLKPVIGILGASILGALRVIDGDGDGGNVRAEPQAKSLTQSRNAKFGIITTGSAWGPLLTTGVLNFLKHNGFQERTGDFAGVETTGMNATELHDLDRAEVDLKMSEATKRLVGRGGVRAICLGCAGMVGMDAVVKAACVAALGETEGRKIVVVDGVGEGIKYLVGQLVSRRQDRGGDTVGLVKS